MHKNKIALFFLIFLGLSTNIPAESGNKKFISLLDKKNKPLTIGHVRFDKTSNGIIYKLIWDDTVFSDQFLSMRPFKCISKNEKMVCHLAYPYAKKNAINNGELTNLEYDLLFLHKSPEEYGINAWNGLYYDLKYVDGGFEGTLKEVDLNILASPPADNNPHPITSDMLHAADPKHHLFPKLIIQ